MTRRSTRDGLVGLLVGAVPVALGTGFVIHHGQHSGTRSPDATTLIYLLLWAFPGLALWGLAAVGWAWWAERRAARDA